MQARREVKKNSKQNEKFDVAVIGGGASGLVAAICAARKGATVVIIERLNRVGKKILATGNGRCNFSNLKLDINRFHGENVKFAESALEKFNLEKTLDFFGKLGIAYQVEDLGKIYPKSEQATSVLDVLRYELQRLNIEERCGLEVAKITQEHDKGTFCLSCFASPQKNMTNETSPCHAVIIADKIILATGGKASPNLGSNGSGYSLARAFKHKIVLTFPVIVQLNLKERFVKQLKGVKFKGKASIVVGREILRTDKGEILFTDYGISGPPILQLSRKAGEQLQNNKQPWIELDLFPDLSYSEMRKLIKKRISFQEKKPIDCNFIGLIHKRLIPVILKEAKIKDANMISRKTNDNQINSIVKVLKQWRFEVVGTQPWKSAQVTAGGVAVKDINPKTMESKLVKGLFFAGEIIDIDGDCGGFNLQWAWSSGYVAGINSYK
ncbi:MAG: NAD(P)/FAD-dependent oxidoreductase [Alkaliphilus sp.]